MATKATEVEKKVTAEKEAPKKKGTTTKKPAEKKAAAKTITTEKKETEAKKAAPEKKAAPAKKETAKKAPAKKAKEIEVNLHVQYAGKSISQKDIENIVTQNYKDAGNDPKKIKTLETYVKIEDNTVYYVINETERGHVVL